MKTPTSSKKVRTFKLSTLKAAFKRRRIYGTGDMEYFEIYSPMFLLGLPILGACFVLSRVLSTMMVFPIVFAALIILPILIVETFFLCVYYRAELKDEPLQARRAFYREIHQLQDQTTTANGTAANHRELAVSAHSSLIRIIQSFEKAGKNPEEEFNVQAAFESYEWVTQAVASLTQANVRMSKLQNVSNEKSAREIERWENFISDLEQEVAQACDSLIDLEVKTLEVKDGNGSFASSILPPRPRLIDAALDNPAPLASTLSFKDYLASSN